MWIVLSLNAAIVCSTNPDSFKVSVWILTCQVHDQTKVKIWIREGNKLHDWEVCRKEDTWMSYCSATAKQLSIAAGVVPQSSWSFSPIAPALIISCNPSGVAVFPWKMGLQTLLLHNKRFYMVRQWKYAWLLVGHDRNGKYFKIHRDEDILSQ